MSNTRYLEIDSTYRNRERHPNPAQFEVLISQTGIRDRFNARDPVSNAAPIITWIPEKLRTPGRVETNDANTKTRFLACFPQPITERVLDFYVGMTIQVGTDTTVITSSKYESTNATSNDCYWLTVTPALSDVPAGTTRIRPYPTFDKTNGVFWIPASVFADNFYNSFVLWNESLQQGAEIIAYEGMTHTGGVDIVANSHVTMWDEGHQYNIRLESPRNFGMFPFAQEVSNLVELPVGFIEIDDFYVGSFIRITDGDHAGETRRIVSYTGPAQVATPARLARLNTGFDTPLLANTKFEILQFTRDNEVPFVYTGSAVSQQAMVCYEIELINLVLPNRTLVSGGRSAFYPYVYVELQNISGASSGNTNIICSNNPHATKRLFRATIDDIPDPLISPFIKIDGDGMVQTIKFKPNDSFKFGVYLPNGDVFDTVTPELFSPAPANSMTQISAVFSMKRL